MISDEEYDRKFDMLVEFEKETGIVFSTSPTHSVGYEVISKLNKVKHSHPMLSLNKTKSADDLVSFMGNRNCVFSLKMDGLTVLLTYDNIDNMDRHSFERFCAKILKSNGFKNVEVTRSSGDQGIDIIAFKDGIKYGVQCKCYASDIGNKAVQEVFSGKTYYKCHVGAVLTNRFFTRSAIELAETNGVLLWDRNCLFEYVKKARISII